jgi:hypothetical protein
VNACSTFLFLDEEQKKKTITSKEKELRKNEKLLKLLRNAISTTKEEDGWSKLSRVGALITNHSSFDSRNYGYGRLSDLLQAAGIFTLKRDSNNHFIVKSNENRT